MNEKWKIVKDIKLKDNLSGHYWRQAGLIDWWMWPDSAPSTQAGISTIMMLVDIHHTYNMLLFIMTFLTKDYFLTVSLSAGWWSSPVRSSSACGSTRSWGRSTGSQVGSQAAGQLSNIHLSSTGWKEADFVTKTVAARNARPNSPTHLNSTLNRPMASQGGTRWEMRLWKRATET